MIEPQLQEQMDRINRIDKINRINTDPKTDQHEAYFVPDLIL
jgi:hypothetical protein